MEGHNKESYFQAQLLPQDPKWSGITCAADQPIYGMNWMNDMGMNRSCVELFAPDKLVFNQKMCKGVIAQADGNEYTEFIDNTEDVVTKEITALALSPFDYSLGWRHYARFGFSDLQEYDMVKTTDKKLHLRILEYGPEFDKVPSSVGKAKYKRLRRPYQPRYGRTYENFGPSFLGQKMFSKFIRTPLERDALYSQDENPKWPIDVAFNFRPVSSPFAGHKTIKDIRYICDPLRHGQEFTPINLNYKLRVTFTVNLFMKNPDYRNPIAAIPKTRLAHNRVTFPYATDFTTRMVNMHNPFQLDNASF